MECKSCQGLGYREYEAGLIRLRCHSCHGTGTIDGNPVRVAPIEIIEEPEKVKIKRKRGRPVRASGR